MIIGICGGSGSGKTTILNRLYSEFKELEPSVFTMDNYYRCQILRVRGCDVCFVSAFIITTDNIIL